MHAAAVRTLALAASLAVLIAAGCSGKALSRAFTAPSSPSTGYSSYDHAWPYTPDGQLYSDPGYRTDPLVRFPATSRLANYNVGNLLSRHLAEFSGAFGGNFATLHQQLPFGLSDVSPLNYVMASPNVFVTKTGDASSPMSAQYSLNLLSARDTVSFVTYGLYAPDSNQRVLSLDVSGAGSFGVDHQHGLYVGVRQFGEPFYHWYGPFKAGDRWHVDALRDSNYANGTAAYVTLAVFNGDNVRLDGLRIDLGG
jgi:hypothetical protein